MAPSTKSVLTVGEDALSKSIQRLGEVDFFSVVTRKPAICDFKPVVVEVALARFISRNQEADEPVQLLRFANRVPLQFDKSGCAITWAIESVNWKSYGLQQPKGSLPLGPYVFAVSLTSPFIKFKNASKETIDASEELVEEIRRALMQAGQKLSRHIKKEFKEADLERKLAHIEQFGPILVETLVRITKSPENRRVKAEEGLRKLLGRDSKEAIADLEEAENKLAKQNSREAKKMGRDEDGDGSEGDVEVDVIGEEIAEQSSKSGTKKEVSVVAAAGTKKQADKAMAGTKKQADMAGTKKQADEPMSTKKK
jgi:DNA topoisomerase-6 subunit B